jgi:hypothetical protein
MAEGIGKGVNFNEPEPKAPRDLHHRQLAECDLPPNPSFANPEVCGDIGHC